MRKCKHGNTDFCCECHYGPISERDTEAQRPADLVAMSRYRRKQFSKGVSMLEIES